MILLINPPSQFLINQKVFPSLGLLYLSTYLWQHGIYSEILDLAGTTDYQYELSKYIGKGVDLVGISSTTPQFVESCKIAAIASSILGCPICIGGPHATVDPESCDMFEYVVVGEGEAAILDYRNWRDGNIRYKEIDDIDTIPYPDRTMIDIKSYEYYIDGELATPVMTSRGCSYNRCSFCSHTWCGIRMHSPEYIYEELRYLKNILGYRAIMFFDDIFAINYSRVHSITNLIRPLDIIYRCFVRSDTATESILRLLKESGCVEIGFGAESGSQRVLDTVGKNNSVENNTRVIETARRLGLRTKAFMVVGLPGESNETCQETYDWLNNVRPDSWDISIYTPYKGSSITNSPELYDINIDYSNFEDLYYKGIQGEYKCHVSTSNLSSEDIVNWREKICNDLGKYRYDHPENRSK